MEFLDAEKIYTVLHLIGVALGAGGAFIADILFFNSVRDRVISDTELRVLRVTSVVIWVGLLILFVSGGLLFSLKPEVYLSSSKFLAKMTIVGVIVLNGLLFHYAHIPLMWENRNKSFLSSTNFMKKAPGLVVSGAVSLISWIFALTLGSLHEVPYTYGAIMALYVVFLVSAILMGIFLRKKIVG